MEIVVKMNMIIKTETVNNQEIIDIRSIANMYFKYKEQYAVELMIYRLPEPNIHILRITEHKLKFFYKNYLITCLHNNEEIIIKDSSIYEFIETENYTKRSN